jgi:uncharacterized membrane protein (UPF0127 family)
MSHKPIEVLHVRVKRTNRPVASRVEVAHSLISRLIGLLNRQRLPAGEGLFIPSCRAVHTLGMRFVMDAVFVDRRWRVVALLERMAPGRLSPLVCGASGVLELPAGTIQETQVEVGDELVCESQISQMIPPPAGRPEAGSHGDPDRLRRSPTGGGMKGSTLCHLWRSYL